MIKHLFLSAAIFLCMTDFAHADGNCAKDSAGVIEVLDQSIVLNEKFKRIADDLDKVQQSRRKVEQFHENSLSPCLKRTVEILSKEDQPELMHKLLEVIVSYENSADEMISYSLGLVFGENPDAFETSLQGFPASKRRLIVKRLRPGWLNAKSEFKEDVISDRESRLQKLRGKPTQKRNPRKAHP